MCAGASTYEALDAAGTKPHHRVGVIGLGGLGHMAVLFVDKSFRSFGTPTHTPLIDTLLICANETPDLEAILPFLARRATIVLMSIQQKPLVVPYMPLILPGHKIIASTEASRQNHHAMIQFAARHRILPWVERFPMTEDGLKAAFDRLERGEMRYRGVLEVPTAGI
jgi:alcohol dehydrogenase (NADP+)